MAPETGTALLVLVAFVLPGFVALRIAELTHEVRRDRSPFELLLVATYYSVICWGLIALASWPFGLTRADLAQSYREESLGRLAGLGLLAIVAVPFAIATLARLWHRSSRVRPWLLKLLGVHLGHATPSAWDELFGRKRPALVRAVLTDKRVVGGFYGANSFAGYSEQSRDLLLEDAWTLDSDDWFVEPAPNTNGVWLAADSIVSLELYNLGYEQSAAEGPDPQRDGASSTEADHSAGEATAEARRGQEVSMSAADKGRPGGAEEKGHPPPEVVQKPAQAPPKPEQIKPKSATE